LKLRDPITVKEEFGRVLRWNEVFRTLFYKLVWSKWFIQLFVAIGIQHRLPGRIALYRSKRIWWDWWLLAFGRNLSQFQKRCSRLRHHDVKEHVLAIIEDLRQINFFDPLVN